MRPEVQPVLDFLHVSSSQAWIAAAADPSNLPVLLSDHANCEKKAASSALGVTYRYVEAIQLLHIMSRLAREELRHFEQVLDLMSEVGVRYEQITAGRYASELHQLVRKVQVRGLEEDRASRGKARLQHGLERVLGDVAVHNDH